MRRYLIPAALAATALAATGGAAFAIAGSVSTSPAPLVHLPDVAGRTVGPSRHDRRPPRPDVDHRRDVHDRCDVHDGSADFRGGHEHRR